MVGKEELITDIFIFISPSETVGAKRFSYLSKYFKKKELQCKCFNSIKNKYYQHLDNNT